MTNQLSFTGSREGKKYFTEGLVSFRPTNGVEDVGDSGCFFGQGRGRSWYHSQTVEVLQG